MATPAKKTAADPEAPKSKKKTGLRLPQVRILAALRGADPRVGLTLPELVKKTKVSAAMLLPALGRQDEDSRKALDTKLGFPSLLTLGFATIDKRPIDGASEDSTRTTTYYRLTAAGTKAAAKVEKLPAVHPAPYSVNPEPAAPPKAKAPKGKGNK
jgi:hypothetical protein